MSVGGGGGVRVAELEVLIRADGTQATSEINSVARSFHNLIAGGALLQAGRGIIDWFKNAITSGAAFEQTMLRVDQLATGAAVGVEALTKKAFAVDQMTIYSAQQIAEAMEQLAREGFSGEQILGDWTDAAVNFAAVINEDLTLSANIMGQVARIFKDEGLEAARTADILSQAILRSGRPAVEFMTGMQYIGGIAAQLGVPLEEVATSLSYLQSVGIRGRSVGTGLRSMFLELAAGADEFGMSHGVQAFDPVTGAFVGMPAIIDQFHELISGMSKAESLQFISDIFGKPASSPLYQLFADGVEAYDAHEEKMKDLGTAATFMKKLMDTIAGSLDRFQAATSNFARSIGVIAGGMLKPLIDIGTAFVGLLTNMPDVVKAATIAIVGFTGALMVLAGAFMIFRGLGGFGMLMTMFSTMGAMTLVAAAGIGVLAGAFLLFKDQIGGWVSSVKEALGPVGVLFDYLDNITQGSNPVAEFLGAMDDGPLKKFAIGAGRVVEAFADLWYFVSQGDWERFIRRLPGELRQAAGGFDIIFDAIGDVDWSEKIKSALQWTGENIVFPAIVAVFEVGMQLLGDAGRWAGNIWGWIKEKLFGPPASFGNAMLSTLTGNTPNSQNGGEPITVGDVIIEAGIQLSGAITAAAGNLWGWIKSQLRSGGTTSTSYSPTGLYSDSGDQIYTATQTTENTMFIGTMFVDALVDKSADLVSWAANSTQTIAGWITDNISVSSVEEAIKQTVTLGVSVVLALTEGAEAVLGGIGAFIAQHANFGYGPSEQVGDGTGGPDPYGMGGNTVMITQWKLLIGNPEYGISVDLVDLSEVPSKLKAKLEGVSTDIGNSIGTWIAEGISSLLGGGEGSDGGTSGILDSNLVTVITNLASSGTLVTAVSDLGKALVEGILGGMNEAWDNGIVNFLNGKVLTAINAIGTGINLVLPNFLEVPEVEFYVQDDGTIGVRSRGAEDGEAAGEAYIGSYEESWLDYMFNNPVMVDPPQFRNSPEWNNFFGPTNVNPVTGAPQSVMHSPGEGYALPEALPGGYGGGIIPSVPIEPLNKIMEARDALVEINNKDFNVTFNADLDENVDRILTTFSGSGSDTPTSSRFSIDLGDAAIKYTEAFSWGEIWESQTFESTFDIFHGPAAIKYTDAFGWGDIWAQQNFVSTFDINNGPAAIRYTDAFSWGITWASQTFTARFSVDLSPLESAAIRAVQLAQIIADNMPHSPARKGPLKEPISFQYIADDFNAVADSIAARTRESAGVIAGGLRSGPTQAAAPDIRLPETRAINNYFFALTADDLARVQQDAASGTLNLADIEKELRMSSGMA